MRRWAVYHACLGMMLNLNFSKWSLSLILPTACPQQPPMFMKGYMWNNQTPFSQLFHAETQEMFDEIQVLDFYPSINPLHASCDKGRETNQQVIDSSKKFLRNSRYLDLSCKLINRFYCVHKYYVFLCTHHFLNPFSLVTSRHCTTSFN